MNEKRHKLLELLSDNYIEFNSDQADSRFILGFSFEHICESMILSRDELELVMSRLYTDKEISCTNIHFDGIHLTGIGASSFTDEKYLNIQRGNDLVVLNNSLVKSNLDSNKISTRNSNISLLIGVVTVIALGVQIYLNNKTQKIEFQIKEVRELIKEQDALENKLDSLISVRNYVIQDSINN